MVDPTMVVRQLIQGYPLLHYYTMKSGYQTTRERAELQNIVEPTCRYYPEGEAPEGHAEALEFFDSAFTDYVRNYLPGYIGVQLADYHQCTEAHLPFKRPSYEQFHFVDSGHKDWDPDYCTGYCTAPNFKTIRDYDPVEGLLLRLDLPNAYYLAAPDSEERFWLHAVEFYNRSELIQLVTRLQALDQLSEAGVAGAVASLRANGHHLGVPDVETRPPTPTELQAVIEVCELVYPGCTCVE